MRSRSFVFVPSLLALSALAVPAADVSMVNLLAADTKVFSGIDFERARNSPFGQYLLNLMTTEGESGLAKFAELTGFDPRRDLQEVMIGSADGAGLRNGAGAVVIVRGHFNPAKIIEAATSHGGSGMVTSYNGTQVVLMGSPHAPSEHAMWAGFLGNLLVAGPKAGVQSAIDRYRSSRKADAALMARILATSAKHDGWLLTTLSPAALAGNVNNPNMRGAMGGDIMQGIESMSAGVKFGANVIVSGEAVARSDKDAAALVDVMRFFSAMAESNGGGNKKGALGLLDSVEMNAEGRTVKFSLSAPSQEFERLFAPQVDRVRNRARRGGTKLD